MRIERILAILSAALLATGCASTSTSRSAADRELENRLRDELHRYGELANEPNVEIRARDGVVTLNGTVRSEKNREMIDSMVRNTSGVASVSDQLAVYAPPSEPPLSPPVVGIPPAEVHDAQPQFPPPPPPGATPPPGITPPTPPPGATPPVEATMVAPNIKASTPADAPVGRRIADRLRREAVPPQNLREVTITVAEGDAYLQGVTDTDASHRAIVGAVRRTPGVNTIHDQLVVSR